VEATEVAAIVTDAGETVASAAVVQEPEQMVAVDPAAGAAPAATLHVATAATGPAATVEATKVAVALDAATKKKREASLVPAASASREVPAILTRVAPIYFAAAASEHSETVAATEVAAIIINAGEAVFAAAAVEEPEEMVAVDPAFGAAAAENMPDARAVTETASTVEATQVAAARDAITQK